MHFANKGLDALKIFNILNNKNIKSKIPPYFTDQSTPIISYTYSRSIASKIFNYKKSLREVDFKDIKSKPPSCSCKNSEFCYSPVGHIITGNLNIVSNYKLRQVISIGPKYRLPQSINWKYNFKLIMDAVECYTRKWAKREEANINSLSEWIKAMRNKINERISKLKTKMKCKTHNIFDDKEVNECLTTLQNKYVIVPADKAPNNVIFCMQEILHQLLA